MKLETRVLHAGEPSPRHQGAVAMPIYQSATFENAEGAGYHDIRYARLSNTPNHLVLHAKLAALENGESALVTSSGMAAISTALLTILSSGDHLLAHRVLYGGTHDLFTRDLHSLGIQFDFIDGADSRDWASKLRPNTKAIYVETMTNPLLEVADHEAVVAFAKTRDIVSMIDNTFASPINFRPPEHGYDLSLHSATKYLNGHSDLIAGAMIGRADLIDSIRKRLNHLGGSLDPHACFLLHRGLKTLALRVKQQNASALEVAKYLAGHPGVVRVNYPGLETHPHHQRAKRLFDGFGGMLSFEPKGGVEAAQRFMSRVRMAIHAPSLGGVETLISRPAAMSHVGMSQKEREEIGIAEELIRVSIGIEATEDLIGDFAEALA